MTKVYTNQIALLESQIKNGQRYASAATTYKLTCLLPSKVIKFIGQNKNIPVIHGGNASEKIICRQSQQKDQQPQSTTIFRLK